MSDPGWQNQWGQEPQQPPPQWGQQGPQWGQPQRSSGEATAALVLGICGILVCPLICSALALIFGYRARREIDASGGMVGGRGSAVAGIVLGWVGVAFALIGIIVFVIAVIAASNDTSSNDFSMLVLW
jgi:hypothetical protein